MRKIFPSSEKNFTSLGKILIAMRKIYKFSKIFLFPYFFLFFILIFLIIYAEKPPKLKKAICSFIFLFFSQCSNFFLAVRTNFSQVHSEEKELALEPFGFPRQFFLPYEPVKNFSHGKKKFSH